MSGQSFKNELAHALARPDVEHLKHSVIVYRDWSARENKSDNDWPEELDVWFDRGDDPDRSLALVLLAAAMCDDPVFLALVAAGLMEDLVTKSNGKYPSDSLVERMVAEARKNARFRWMLSGVWTASCRPVHAEMIARAVGGYTMDHTELPERPHP